MPLSDTLRQSQASWASRQVNIQVDEKGYVQTVAPNLFRPMLDETAAEFHAGSGGELRFHTGRRPKMCALHSSSILACNVFDYWRAHGVALVGEAIDLPFMVSRLTFETKFPSGLPGEPPNLDVVLWEATGRLLAVESKFTEPFGRPKSRRPFKAKYFPDGKPVWNQRRLKACGSLARDLQDGRTRYRHLDAAQLLKHLLGLQANHSGNFTLAYLYVDDPGHEGSRHRRELDDFTKRIAGEVPFTAISYQTLVSKLRALAGNTHDDYFTYLRERYLFPAA